MAHANGDYSLIQIDTEIGASLKKMRLLRGLSTEDLGILVGVSGSQVEKYENGTNRISAALLFQFSRLLKSELRDFFP